MMLHLKKILIIFLLLICGCNPFYVTRAAYEELKILHNRKDIATLLKEEKLPEEELKKLTLVNEARAYAEKIGLTPKKTFTKYAKVDDKPLVWVVSAAYSDQFKLYTWWFPIVGSVPYKGYFSKDDAISLAKELQKDGYETYLRGAMAFSTLGWFNDPVLSNLLKKDDTQIVNTVIHEIVHTTVWYPGNVTINESLANFIGTQETLNFYKLKLSLCKKNNCSQEQIEKLNTLYKKSASNLQTEILLSQTMASLYSKLNKLYQSDLDKSLKLKKRQIIFEEVMSPVRKKVNKLLILKKINNAEIMQQKLYLTGISDFRDLYLASDKNTLKFLKRIKKIFKQAEKAKNTQKKFFKLLRVENSKYRLKKEEQKENTTTQTPTGNAQASHE